ncbi:hypothetical protein ACTA71_011632 [Dictyostelium dimigraforme]
MLSIKTCRSIVNLASKQQQPQQFLAGYAAKVVKKGRGGKKSDEDEERGADISSKYDVKVSKASYQKIIQRFQTLFRRPENVDKNESDEEKQLRKTIYNFTLYSNEIIKERDREEKAKLDYQWDAIMELPEDLRKIALLIETDQEMPLIEFLYDTPPTKDDPKKSIQLKKKDKSIKPSERELLTNSIQS